MKFLVQATWDDVPHLSEAAKAELWRAIPPYQRDARSKGIPTLGAGAIFPIPESDIVVPDFPLPDHWPRYYGLDVGWNRTAAVWAALNRETGVSYYYSEHYRAEAEPAVHVAAVKARGEWIHGAIDPSSHNRGPIDGRNLLQEYTGLGLKLAEAENAVEAGLLRMWTYLSTGRIKVFASLRNWLAEFRMYRRDEKGRVVKEHDHLMDASRYAEMTARALARCKPVKPETKVHYLEVDGGIGGAGTGWMG